MKKITLLLFIIVANISFGQTTLATKLKITGNVTDNAATKVNVQDANGVINTIPKSDLVNVIEVNDVPSLPLIGEVGKIYVVKNVNKIYRWNGTFYQELSVLDISGKVDKNTPITAATKTKITYDAKGLVTAGSDLLASDIPTIAQSQVTNLTSDLANKENVVNKVTSLASPNNTTYPTAQLLKDQLDLKQNTLTNSLTGVGSNADPRTYALQDGTILYHSVKWFTPTSTVSTSGTTVTSVGTQFTPAMVGAKLTINGEWRIITAFTNTTTVVVASAYSQNYSEVVAGSWGVYSRFIVTNGQNSTSVYNITDFYGWNGVKSFLIDGNKLSVDILRGASNNVNYETNQTVLGGNRQVIWTNNTTGVNEVGGTKDLGLRRNAAGVLEIYDGITATGLEANRRDLLSRNVAASKVLIGATVDTDDVLKISNRLGIKTYGVTGNGDITGNTYNGYTPENVVNKVTDIATGANNTTYPTSLAVKNETDLKIPLIQKGAINGVATLGSDGKVPNSQIPALAISETFPVNSQAAMLALSGAEKGDVAVRTDISKSFILTQSPASTLGNWQELLAPTDAVQSVNGQTGNVNLTTANISDSSNKRYQTDAQQANNNATSPIQGQLDGKETVIPIKNTAFNKNFGTIAGTVAEGNDSRILNGQTAFSWGNHSGLYPTYSGTGATGTWGINITGNASSATKWNGLDIALATYSTGIIASALIYNSTNSRVEFGDLQTYKTWLGLGSNAYTSTAYLPLTGNAVTASELYKATDGGTDLNTATVGKHTNYSSAWYNSTGGPSSAMYGTAYNFGGTNASTLSLQVLADVNHNSTSSTKDFYFRTGNNLGFQNDWKKMWHDGNFNPANYLPLSGGTVNGTVTASPATVDTELATLGQAKAAARPYKVYTALLSQSGTNAPVATVLENTLGGTVVWSRSGTGGNYDATLSGAFTSNKTSALSSPTYTSGNYALAIPQYTSTSTVHFKTINVGTDLGTDDLLDNTFIEIRVYP